MARSNNRPPILLSSLPPNRFALKPDGKLLVIVCPDCGAWRSVKRSMINPHRKPHGPEFAEVDELLQPPPGRCAGSGQRLECDLAYAEWALVLKTADRLARHRTDRLRLPHARRSAPVPTVPR